MKRFFILVFIAFAASSCAKHTFEKQSENESQKATVVSDENYDFKAPIEYVGTYLPVKYLSDVEKYRSHSLAMHDSQAYYHNLLCVNENKIYSDSKWHDSYAIKKNEADAFKFLVKDGFQTIIDNKGYEYLKISDETKNYNKIIKGIVAKIVLKGLLEKDLVQVINDNVVINGNEYEVILDDMFFPQNCNLLLNSLKEKNCIGLVIEDQEYIFYKLVAAEEMGSKLSDEIAYKY